MSVAWFIIAVVAALIAIAFFYNHGKRKTPADPSATPVDGGGGSPDCSDGSGADGACDGGGGDGGGGD